MERNIHHRVTSFFWTIKNFDMCPHLRNESLNSPNFSIGSYEFSFHLYPRGLEDPNYIRGGLKRLNDNGGEKVLVSWKMSVLERGASISKYNFTSENVFEKDCTWGEGKFIPRHQLLKSEILLPRNSLYIECDILSLSVCKSNVDDSGDDDNKLDDNEDADILSSDFAQILNSRIYSDLVLHVDENVFSVHKSILQCRCPKLMSAATRSLVGDNNYLLHGIEASVFRTMLNYLYTGTSNISDIDEVTLITADKFDIPDLRHSFVYSPFKTICATTEIVVSQLSFKWVIEDISKIQQYHEFVYQAFCVNADELCGVELILTIVKRKDGLNAFQLKFKTQENSKVGFLRCKISISEQISADTKIHVDREYEHIFVEKDWVTPFGSQIKLRQVSLQDKLSIFFIISMSKRETHSNIDSITVEDKTEKPGSGFIKNLKTLQRDLRQMYDDIDNSTSADITLSVGDEKYRAHKFILCGRSPIFAMMFANDSLEHKEGVVTIDDIDGETISSMLRYIYCGCVTGMGIPEAINLYAAADKYELLTLRDKCATFLKASMDAYHVGNILLLADAHHDESLKKYVCDYIFTNFNKVMESKDSLSVLERRTDAVNDLLQQMASKD